MKDSLTGYDPSIFKGTTDFGRIYVCGRGTSSCFNEMLVLIMLVLLTKQGL